MFNIKEFRNIIEAFNKTLQQVPDKYTTIRLAEDKWSLKEIAGHLIDSAANNHQRFVRLQEGNLISFPGYNQESWIQIQKYNEFDWYELIEFWKLYNILLVHIIEEMDQATLNNIFVLDGEKLRLDWLVNDYFEHMKWHIKHFESRLTEITEVGR